MRARITPKRLEQLCAHFTAPPVEPRVFWIVVVALEIDRGQQEALLAAIKDAVWDEVVPLARRWEVLGSIDVVDRDHAKVEVTGRWWEVHLDLDPDPPHVEIVGRGMRRWLREQLGLPEDTANEGVG